MVVFDSLVCAVQRASQEHVRIYYGILVVHFCFFVSVCSNINAFASEECALLVNLSHGT